MKGVIFDVDGVLLDSMPVWMHAGERYLERKGETAGPELGKILFCMSMSEGAEYLKKNWNLQETEGEICEGVNQVVQDFYRNEIPLKPGVLETLEALKKGNVPAVIATSTDEPVVKTALQRLGIEKYFLKVFTCTAVGAGKTKPDIFYAAADFINKQQPGGSADYSDFYVVEDSLYAAKTATAAGFKVIGIYDEASRDDWEELCELADIHSREMKAELFEE